MLVCELEGLHESEGLVDITPHGQVVDGDLTKVALIVNDEKTTESNAIILLEDSVVFSDLAGLVCEEGDLHVSETALLTGGVDPGEMAEHAVGGACYDLTVDGAELFSPITEGDDLSGAHECEVKWIEEEYHIFAFVVIKTDFFEFAINNGLSLEDWGGFCELSLRHG